MLRSEHAKSDFEILATKINDKTVSIADVGTVVITLGKLLLSIRSNQISIMKKLEVELQKPRVRTEEKKAE